MYSKCKRSSLCQDQINLINQSFRSPPHPFRSLELHFQTILQGPCMPDSMYQLENIAPQQKTRPTHIPHPTSIHTKPSRYIHTSNTHKHTQKHTQKPQQTPTPKQHPKKQHPKKQNRKNILPYIIVSIV